jgi:hypothetical protein
MTATSVVHGQEKRVPLCTPGGDTISHLHGEVVNLEHPGVRRDVSRCTHLAPPTSFFKLGHVHSWGLSVGGAVVGRVDPVWYPASRKYGACSCCAMPNSMPIPVARWVYLPHSTITIPRARMRLRASSRQVLDAT